eukprot:6020851-Alexandrium_andersonii.AAC.1
MTVAQDRRPPSGPRAASRVGQHVRRGTPGCAVAAPGSARPVMGARRAATPRRNVAPRLSGRGPHSGGSSGRCRQRLRGAPTPAPRPAQRPRCASSRPGRLR